MAVLYILSKIDSRGTEENSYPIQCFKNKAQAVKAFNDIKDELLQRLLAEKRTKDNKDGISCLKWYDDSDVQNLARAVHRMRYAISYEREVKDEFFSWTNTVQITEGYRLDRVPYQPKPKQ